MIASEETHCGMANFRNKLSDNSVRNSHDSALSHCEIAL